MGPVLQAVRPATGAGGSTERRRRVASLLILLSYLAAALVLTWRIWADPTQIALNNGNDICLNIWFMRYVESALAHGHLPTLVTHEMNAPQGVSSMWNTSLLLPGAVLAPVTAIAGPVFSLAILTTLGLAGSAATMFWVLRRWNVQIGAAALGGMFYGFSPALVVAGEDHYHLEFAVLPPLIVHFALRLATDGRHPLRNGLWLGLLISAQLFIAEELLLDTAIACGVVLVILAVNRPRQVPGQLREAIVGGATAGGVLLVLGGYALWRQFTGPLTEHGTPWHTLQYGDHLATFVTSPRAVLINNPTQFENFLRSIGMWQLETYGYLGWPLVIALIVIPVVCWKDVRIRVMSLSFWAFEWLGMGAHQQHMVWFQVPARFFPWYYLRQLPIISEIIVTRLPILADGMAAAVVALAAARIIAAVRSRGDWRRPAVASAAGVALAAIVIPLIPRPLPARAIVPPPPGWRAVISALHLRPYAPVLVLPLQPGLVMEWQAATNVPISVVGGYCVAPDATGKATPCDTRSMETGAERTIDLQSVSIGSYRSNRPFRDSTLLVALRQWRAAAVLVTPDANPALGRDAERLLGPPRARQGGMLGWRLPAGGYRHLPRPHQAAQAHARTGGGPGPDRGNRRPGRSR
jgi:hypothetical protein